MKSISTYQVYEYLCEKFPDLKDVLKNGFIDKHENKCVGVFLAPSTRNLPNMALGGPDCTTVKMLPVNILLHWTKNQKDCSEKANEILQQADVLVNPRQNDDEYTKYSFPSKNIEYLRPFAKQNTSNAFILFGMPII